MCAGKDEQKPHLHYDKTSRALADRLSELSGTTPGALLQISTMIGIIGLIQTIASQLHQDAATIDAMKYVSLRATEGAAKTHYCSRKAEIDRVLDSICESFQLNQEELPF